MKKWIYALVVFGGLLRIGLPVYADAPMKSLSVSDVLPLAIEEKLDTLSLSRNLADGNLIMHELNHQIEEMDALIPGVSNTGYIQEYRFIQTHQFDSTTV